MSWTLRDAHRDDLPAIVAIEQRSFSDPWSAEMFQAHLGGEPFLFLVAHEGAVREGMGHGRSAHPIEGVTLPPIVGFAVAQVVASTAELFEIAVAREARRRGVGAALLDEVLARCRALGAGAITLEVRESNQPARALYESRGFATVGRRKRYYRDPTEDGLLLQLPLVDPGDPPRAMK